MAVRHVQVRGCLPTLVALLVIGAVIAAFVTASAAFLAVAVGAGLVAAALRWVRGLAKPQKTKTPAARRAADVTIDAEIVERSEGDDRPPRRLE